MGWWKQEPTGESFADRGNLMWGDEPADAIDVALRGVVEAFQRDLHRPPRIEEILAGVRFSAAGKGIVLGPGVRYCECESPVMDPMHDEGCRRCGLPVNFAPQTQTITHPDDVADGDHVMSGPLTGGLFDLRVTPAQLRAAADVVMVGENVADVELLADDRMLIVTQGDCRAAFDTGGEPASAEYLAAAPLDRVTREPDPSDEERRLALQDDLVSGVLDVARRRADTPTEIADWSVKAELEDELEVQVAFASGVVSLYRAHVGEEPQLVWTEPADAAALAAAAPPPAPTAAQLGLRDGPFAEEAARVDRFVSEHPQLHRDLALTGQRQRELAARRAERRSPFDGLDRGWFITNLRAAAPPGFDYTADEELAGALVTHALQALDAERGEGEEDDGHDHDRAVARVAAAFEVLYGLAEITQRGGVA